jgi:phospholipid N-methyltransferase
MSETAATAETGDTDDATAEGLLQVGFGFLSSRVLIAGIELGLYTELSESGPLSADAIAERLDLDARRGLRDALDILVAEGVLARSPDGYENAPATEQFLLPERPEYVGDFLALAGERMYRSAADTTACLKTNEPGNELDDDQTFWEGQVYETDESRDRFLDAMAGLSCRAARRVAEAVDWDGLDRVCDLGTGKGVVPCRIAEHDPELTAVGVDLPEVEPHFREFVADSDAADRVTFAAADFFADPLPEADAYVLGHVLHDWGLDQKRRLLERAYDHLPEGGRVIVYGTMLDESRSENLFGLYMSLLMLLELQDGFDYTRSECRAWLTDAGFSDVRHVPVAGAESVLVAER